VGTALRLPCEPATQIYDFGKVVPLACLQMFAAPVLAALGKASVVQTLTLESRWGSIAKIVGSGVQMWETRCDVQLVEFRCGHYDVVWEGSCAVLQFVMQCVVEKYVPFPVSH
jgi:hypothetical protein